MNETEKNQVDDDIEEELEKQWKLQDQIHPKCKMKDKEKKFHIK